MGFSYLFLYFYLIFNKKLNQMFSFNFFNQNQTFILLILINFVFPIFNYSTFIKFKILKNYLNNFILFLDSHYSFNICLDFIFPIFYNYF